MSFGFGTNTNTGGGFGSGGFGSSNTTGFGANNTTSTAGSLFGGNTATSGGFGFGTNNATNNNNPFGQNKPNTGFGTSTTGGNSLFGGNTNTNTGTFGSGGMFGANNNTNNNNNATSAFGASTGGGLFGNKPATTGFGASTANNTSSLFGGNTTGGFGTTNNATTNPFATTNTANNNTTSGFGAATNTGTGFGGFGATNAATTNNGTASVPFQSVTEKDGATNTTSAYQSISFQDPYKTKTFEELRVEDYLQGRRYGNSNGQAGGFGQSTGFGGFGATNTANTNTGGLFGANNTNNAAATTSTFGGFGTNTATNNTTSAFGNTNTVGGLFGANKPATGGLFGQANTTPATGGFGTNTTNTTGGLFGAANNTTTNTGFGAGNTAGGSLFGNTAATGQTNTFGANTNTGGSLFGSAATQNKPATGLFGNAGTTNTGGSLFGSNNNQQTGGSLFGNTQNTNTGSSLFGNNNAQQAKPTGFGGFGAAANPATSAFGTNAAAGNSLFGNTGTQNTAGTGLFGAQTQANKPGGLFGNTTNTAGTTGGLFGNTQQQQSGASLFGNTNNTAAGTSLFGTNQNKSLFGNTTTNNSGGSSLFGNTQQAQNPTAGSSLFGGAAQSNGNSLFGNSMQTTQPQNQLHTSLTVSPYGNDQLFASLAAPAPPVGPLATPLQSAKPTPKKTQSLLGTMRVNSPVYTPRASTLGRMAGYGISYSNFGTPNSSFSSTLTPGATSLLRSSASVNSALTSRLSKSFSTSNLRGETTSEGTSLMRPSPLTPGNTGPRYGGGSMRKLRIDRSLRQDLFEPIAKDNDGRRDSDVRRVNFEDSADSPVGPSDATPTAQNALVTEEQALADRATDNPKTNLFKTDPRQNSQNARNGESSNGVGALTTVPENGVPRAGSAPSADLDSPNDPGEPGEYFTKPSLDQLRKMSRKQLEKIGNFTVGRNGVGTIRFHSCDLTSVPLDDVCGKIVELVTRNATVYPKDINKPPEGQGLNVPATIVLDNSWPKAARGKKLVLDVNSKAYKGHIKRLKEVTDTRFVSYDQENGAWTFEVDHFTTYALDDDDDDEDDMTERSSALSEAPATPTYHEDTMQSIESMQGEVDDTFHFKHDRKAQQILPGTFDSEVISFLGEPMDAEHEHVSEVSSEAEETPMEDPFISAAGPARAPPSRAMTRFLNGGNKNDEIEPQDQSEDELLDSVDVPGAFVPAPALPRSILKPRTAVQNLESPAKMVTDTWEEQLQRTMSPKKRDRIALRDMQQSFAARAQNDGIDGSLKHSVLGQSILGQSYLAQKTGNKRIDNGRNKDLGKSQAFTTSMDIMNSLWANEKSGLKPNGPKNLESTQSRQAQRLFNNSADNTFPEGFKPHFNPSTGILVYSVPDSAAQVSGQLTLAVNPILGENQHVRFAKFATLPDFNAPTFAVLKDATHISASANAADEIPLAKIQGVTFSRFADAAKAEGGTRLEMQETTVWKLCSILFDPLRIGCAPYVEGIPEEELDGYAWRIQADAFKQFWAGTVASTVEKQLSQAKTAEHKALIYLTLNNIPAASETLLAVGDNRLAIMIAQLPGNSASREVLRTQIAAWRQRKDWSEMSEGIRALYSILAGEVCLVPGQDGAPEDKANDFCISEKFGLTWQQALALRVFYGGHASLKEAIQTYCTDLDDERESVTPTTLWDLDFDGDDFMDKEDTLMTLLRLFSRPDAETLPTLIDPLTVSGNALNSRLAWQLAVVLQTQSVTSLDHETVDRLSIDFSAELETSFDILDAAFVLLYVSDNATRHRAMAAFLERNGDKIASPNEDGEGSDFLVLTEYLHIPAALVWAAKATYAATTDDFDHAYWLLKAHQANPAGNYDSAAHQVLCARVAPQAIIEEDYERLDELVRAFQSSPRKPENWDLGGAVYADFLQLLGLRVSQRSSASGRQILGSLQTGLNSMREAAASGKKISLEERVARLELQRFADTVAKDVDADDVFVGAGPSASRGDQVMVDASAYGSLVPTDLFRAYQRAMGVVA